MEVGIHANITTNFRDLKASGIYVMLYNLMSGDKEDNMSPLRIIFAGGLAGQKQNIYSFTITRILSIN